MLGRDRQIGGLTGDDAMRDRGLVPARKRPEAANRDAVLPGRQLEALMLPFAQLGNVLLVDVDDVDDALADEGLRACQHDFAGVRGVHERQLLEGDRLRSSAGDRDHRQQNDDWFRIHLELLLAPILTRGIIGPQYFWRRLWRKKPLSRSRSSPARRRSR